jgi:transketolase
VTLYWRAFVGDEGDVMGVDSYGESAPLNAVMQHFGLTVDHVVSRLDALIGS